MSQQQASVTITPDVAGTEVTPQSASVTLRAWFDDVSPDLGRAVQFATVNGTFFLPKGVVTTDSAACSAATVFQDERLCPAASRVGDGAAVFRGLGLVESVKLQAFNQPGGSGVGVLVTGTIPLIIREVVPAKLTRLTGDPKSSSELTLTIPRNLQSPAPGVIAALEDFRVTFPTHDPYAYFATTGCTGGVWPSRYVAGYTTSFDGSLDGGMQAVASSVPCQNAPQITVAAPGDGAAYTRGAPVLADYSCADADGAADIRTCAGQVAVGEPVDTSTTGTKTFSVSATDVAGNTRSRSVTYTVIGAGPPAVTPPPSTPRPLALRSLTARAGGSIALRFTVPASGRLTVRATTTSSGATRTLTFASITRTVRAGVVVVTLRPTKQAKHLLARRKKLKVRIRAVFVPSLGARPAAVTRTAVVRAKR